MKIYKSNATGDANPDGSQAAIDAAKNAVTNAQNAVTSATAAYNQNEANISQLTTTTLPGLQKGQQDAEDKWKYLSGSVGVAEDIFLGRFGNIKDAQAAKDQEQSLTQQIADQTANLNQLIANRTSLKDAITQAQNDANTAQANLSTQQADAGAYVLAQSQGAALTNPAIVASKAALQQSMTQSSTINMVIIVVAILIALGAAVYLIKSDNIKL